MTRSKQFLSLVTLALISTNSLQAAPVDPLAWPPITAQARPWAWWWWHGSAVDETNISHELQRFHDAGLGGVQITSIYGTKGAEAREIPYLSPRWLDMMGYTVDQAHHLGMGVDMTLGSGWCFGGPTVSPQDANASVVVKTYKLAMGERITDKLDRKNIQALVAFSPEGKSIDLTDGISTNGEVFFSPPGNWIGTNAPPKTWTVYAISQKPSGQKVKRPAIGGEGWMLNPAYPQAMRDWLPWFDQALANYHGSKPEAVFQDSYEYRTDWAPDFFAQFEKLRGYKLQTELPALFGDAQDDHTARVKYDYRRTLSDIMAGQSEPVWIDWAHKNGMKAIYQAHGTPGNWLDLYGDADMPETEMFHNDRNILISKFASSAAHTQGHPLTGAETGTWLEEHFTETLADLKYLADDMFLSGVNHIYYHGTCYSPDDAPWPGWLFYASTEMNPRNPIWHDVGTLNEYIARCQSVLQEGKPDNDILLYWPVADFWSDPAGGVQAMSVGKSEWFENQPIGKAAHELWDQGYAFDYVSDAQLLKAKFIDGNVLMSGGSYKTIVVPECKYMPLETFKQLLALADEGATVIFIKKLPADVPGNGDLGKQREQFDKLVSRLSFQPVETRLGKVQEVRRGAGHIIQRDLIATYSWGDARQENMAYSGLTFVRRSFEGGRNYFIVNRTNRSFDGWIRLSPLLSSVVLLDPMSGTSRIPATTSGSLDPGATPWVEKIHLQLPAGQSAIIRGFEGRRANGPACEYWKPRSPSVEITGGWTVKFLEGGPTLPATFQTAKLASWTTFADTNAQAFAGTAIYETKFDAPDLSGKTVELSLGDVRQSARVRLNGKDYGTLITPPFSVVVDNLKPTGNQLEVEVTSVAANRIRDLDRRHVNWKIFKDINIVDVNYRPFDASHWPLTDCGLLGPVTLTAVVAK